MGLNNIELITDRPLEVNLREIREVKKRYPKHVVIASLMVETKDDWKVLIQQCEDAGADGLELNFGCPHGMCERGMGSAVGQEPKLLQEITSWAKEFAKTPVLVKLTPNIGDILEPGLAGVARRRRRPLAHQHHQEHHRRRSRSARPRAARRQRVDQRRLLRPGGEADRAPHGRGARARSRHRASRSRGIGGISDWRDAAEFIALGSTSVQVCTAVMHYGYRIVEDMIEGLSEYLDSHGMKSVNELRGRAVPGYQEWGDLDLNYKLVAKIDPKMCIGCQLCVTACNDGAHQCIFTGPDDKPRPPHAHAIGPAKAPKPAPDRPARGRSRPVDRRAGVRRLQPLSARVPGARLHHDGRGAQGRARDLERSRRGGPRQAARRHPRSDGTGH